MNASTRRSLYDRCGGFAAISRIVLDFYDRMLDHDDLARFFESVDLDRVIEHQTKLFAHLTGGPADYSLERLALAHARLGIGDDDFDEMRVLLEDALIVNGIEAEDRAQILAAVDAQRPVVVTRRAA
ncbi:group 1 truncated hemoglobin [Albimonas sp. CAU 1670]|uniref:group I truncated hemoglobin n=1 Tax=Albimonas sp. CAU 1670 TaxID=3032599 RepID=UPI0023DBE1C4|nr:group 1 truncated hemoglobin [Albimonas sp. CAU 1670]MDF2235464.1 group 1 truncated hemoglobin [Albimonas sp. CAU 1670]